MSLGILVGAATAVFAIVAAILLGLISLFARRGQSAPRLPFYAGGVAWLFVTASLVGHSEWLHHIPHLVRACLLYTSELGLRSGRPVDLAFSPERNHWNGYDRVQLRIKALRMSGEVA